MNAAVDARGARGFGPILLAVLGVLAFALLWFLSRKIHYFANYSLASYSEYYWPRRIGLLLHLTGGVTAISVGLVQIWLGLTNRVGALHHALGRLYGTGIVLGSAGGFYLALTIPNHLPYAAGLFMLCVAWVLTTGMAIFSIRRRRIEQHRDWMLRSYTVTFAFVTFRLASTWLGGWIHVPDDPVADEIDTMMAWASWAVPLLLAEPIIQLRSILRQKAALAR